MKKRVTVSIQEKNFAALETIRGLVPRSAFIDNILNEFLKKVKQ
jgi:hypothetical protein